MLQVWQRWTAEPLCCGVAIISQVPAHVGVSGCFEKRGLGGKPQCLLGSCWPDRTVRLPGEANDRHSVEQVKGFIGPRDKGFSRDLVQAEQHSGRSRVDQNGAGQENPLRGRDRKLCYRTKKYRTQKVQKLADATGCEQTLQSVSSDGLLTARLRHALSSQAITLVLVT